jgi:hypothetical protein
MGINIQTIVEREGKLSLTGEKWFDEDYNDCYNYIHTLTGNGFSVSIRHDLQNEFDEMVIEIRDADCPNEWVSYEMIWKEEEISEGLRRLIKLRGLDWAISNQWI